MIIPCFNEGSRLNIPYFKKLSRIKNTYWVFINDGSEDNTEELLKTLSKLNNVKVIALSSNSGKSQAIKTGMQFAFNSYVNIGFIGFLDADCAFSVNDVENVINTSKNLHQYDAVYSARVKLAGRDIRRSFKRHIIARIVASIFGFFWKDIPYDTQSGLKIFKDSRYIRDIFSETFNTRWFLDIEISIRYAKIMGRGLNVWEVPVSSWRDVPGSKIGFYESLRILKEIIYILKNLVRLNNPKVQSALFNKRLNKNFC
jgi:dolichyl-phosphate beta-glucosyltransferase